MRESLLNGLQTEFAAYRGRTEEIERLLDDTSQRAVYLRLMADGLQQARKWRPSLDHYLRLIELDRGNRGMEVMDRSLVVRHDLGSGPAWPHCATRFQPRPWLKSTRWSNSS